MALTLYPDKLRSTKSNESNEKRSYLAVKCDNSYVTGGYSLDIRAYFSNYNFINISVNNQQPFKAFWAQDTNKLLVAYSNGTEVGTGTDLSSVWFLIESIQVPGIPSPTMLPTVPVQAGSGSGALEKAGDTIKTSGNLTIASGASQTIAGGASQEIESGASLRVYGAKIAPTNITIAIGDTTPSVAGKNYLIVDGTITPSLTNFHNGEAGQSIGIYCTAGTCVITHDLTKISLKGKANVTMSAGDSISFMSIGAVWYELASSIKDGSSVVASTGTQTIAGTQVVSGAVVNVPTNVGSSTPDVAGKTYLSVSSATTATITNFLNGVANQYLLLDCSLGVVTLVSSSNVSINGNFVMNTLDTITLQYRGGVWYEIQRNVYSGRVGGNLLPLTFGANIAINATNSNAYSLVTTGDCTLTITGGNPGWTLVILITNDAGAGHTVAFGSGFRAGASLVGITNKVASLTFNYDGSSWFETSRTENL